MIVSRYCDRLKSRTGNWILILRTRLFILPNNKTPFWSMWSLNTVPKANICPSHNPTAYQVSSSSPSATVSGSGESSLDRYDLCSDDADCVLSRNVAGMMITWSDLTIHILPAGGLCLNLPPDFKIHCGQLNLNLNYYHSDPMEISNTLRIQDITNWWHQH